MLVLREIIERLIQRNAIRIADGIEHRFPNWVNSDWPEFQRAFTERQVSVDEQFQMSAMAGPQSFAMGTPALLVIERKLIRRKSLKLIATFLTGQIMAKDPTFPFLFVTTGIDCHHFQPTAADCQSAFDAIGQASSLIRSHHDPIDDYAREGKRTPQQLLAESVVAKNYSRLKMAEEKRLNPRLNVGIDEAGFVNIMESLELPVPRLIDEAVPANLACGMEAQ